MGRRVVCVLAAVAFLATAAHAKPLTVWADFEVRRAVLVAEVEILSIVPGRQWGRGWQDFDIRVRVTSAPDRIYRGFAELGTEITLSATSGGWRGCSQQLGEWQRQKRKPLLIVDDRRQVRMAGLRTSSGYRLQGFFDFNACWVRCQDTTFGTVNGGRTRVDVRLRNMRKIHRVAQRAFWARVARFVAQEPPGLGPGQLRTLVAELSAPEQARRVGAHQRLVTNGTLAVGALRKAADRTTDPEARRRILTVLRTLQPYETAWGVAQRVPKKARVWVLTEGMPGLTGDALLQAKRARDALKRGDPIPPPKKR